MRPAPDARDADGLRAARLAARERRLPVRRAPGRRDRHGRARARLPARGGRHARHRAAHQHVLLRREPAASHRLPSRGARLGRAAGRDRRRRMALASAAQSEADAHDVVRDARARAGSVSCNAIASFASYEDDEARYDLRPSAWVEPVGSWGPGRVELVQLHTADETNDNIVAYWVPERLPAAGRAARLRLSPALARRADAAAARRLGHADACRPRLRRARRRRAAVRRRLHRPVARRACRPTRRSRPSSPRRRTGRSSRATPTASRRPARGA